MKGRAGGPGFRRFPLKEGRLMEQEAVPNVFSALSGNKAPPSSA